MLAVLQQKCLTFSMQNNKLPAPLNISMKLNHTGRASRSHRGAEAECLRFIGIPARLRNHETRPRYACHTPILAAAPPIHKVKQNLLSPSNIINNFCIIEKCRARASILHLWIGKSTARPLPCDRAQPLWAWDERGVSTLTGQKHTLVLS
jgi:hypothetical protein